jgi:hypothetical protein
MLTIKMYVMFYQVRRTYDTARVGNKVRAQMCLCVRVREKKTRFSGGTDLVK